MTQFGSYITEDIVSDLSVFADIGTDSPNLFDANGRSLIRFVRRGTISELSAEHDAIIECVDGELVRHANFKALLASDRYGGLRDWAAKQVSYFKQLNFNQRYLDQFGRLDNGVEQHGIDSIDDLLSSALPENAARIMLIDGPAGIGKTQFIQRIASNRAHEYNAKRRPLVLHVQSRGRTLSFIYDLMAFSLQRLRIDVTFDQIPVLAKHGLVTVAIDGFDELADPDGHDLAWSQVSDFILNLRGSGSAILAGRETFIGRERIIKDIAAIRADIDQLHVLTLQPPTRSEALRWLSSEGWASGQLNIIEDYLEPSSLALRPFFLKTLSDSSVARSISESQSTSILSILMESMVLREITKFGEAVESELTQGERISFVQTLMCEVAQDMADNSSVAISDGSLAWLVEVALPKQVSETAMRVLKGRSQVLAFLTNDDRAGYRRFYHDKFFEYFLSIALIDTIEKRAMSKPLARNLFGSSLLETFCDIIASNNLENDGAKFISNAVRLANEAPPIDRTPKNAGALLIASLAIADVVPDFHLNGVSIDEARFSGIAAGAVFENIIVSQFDCRGADITNVEFRNSNIITVIGDGETLLSDSFPYPVRIQDVAKGALADPPLVAEWIHTHRKNPPKEPDGLVPEEFKSHPLIETLEKACRLRQHWLRKGDDRYASRILNNEWWPVIETALESSDLIKIEVRPASGSDARFLHIRQSDDILLMNESNPDVKKLYALLVQSIRSSQPN